MKTFLTCKCGAIVGCDRQEIGEEVVYGKLCFKSCLTIARCKDRRETQKNTKKSTIKCPCCELEGNKNDY